MRIRIRSTAITVISVAMLLAISRTALGSGHGPAFSLATPTLGEGQWSSDTMGMALTNEDDTAFMTREVLGYGVTEDFQLNLSFPLSPVINKLKDPPRTRLNAMMGGFTDVELGLMWRFQREAPRVGTRYESTLFLSGGIPADDEIGGVGAGPLLNIAAVTGYASRDWYWWFGGGYEHRFERGGDQLGGLPYLTAAVAYRPPIFQQDYPKPDWRIFLEGIAEFPQRDEINGHDDPDSGGERILIGPSILGLTGRWGFEAGILFPVYQDLNGDQDEERWRANVTITFWP